MAKNVPDSRTPRRFNAVKISTAAAATQASCPSMNGSSDFALCTPDEMDTATVNT
jgi:hypothetical protein